MDRLSLHAANVTAAHTDPKASAPRPFTSTSAQLYTVPLLSDIVRLQFSADSLDELCHSLLSGFVLQTLVNHWQVSVMQLWGGAGFITCDYTKRDNWLWLTSDLNQMCPGDVSICVELFN